MGDATYGQYTTGQTASLADFLLTNPYELRGVYGSHRERKNEGLYNYMSPRYRDLGDLQYAYDPVNANYGDDYTGAYDVDWAGTDLERHQGTIRESSARDGFGRNFYENHPYLREYLENMR